jgi:hypothetical protein
VELQSLLDLSQRPVTRLEAAAAQQEVNPFLRSFGIHQDEYIRNLRKDKGMSKTGLVQTTKLSNRLR